MVRQFQRINMNIVSSHYKLETSFFHEQFTFFLSSIFSSSLRKEISCRHHVMTWMLLFDCLVQLVLWMFILPKWCYSSRHMSRQSQSVVSCIINMEKSLVKNRKSSKTHFEKIQKMSFELVWNKSSQYWYAEILAASLSYVQQIFQTIWIHVQ